MCQSQSEGHINNITNTNVPILNSNLTQTLFIQADRQIIATSQVLSATCFNQFFLLLFWDQKS